jgi:hypothetical protein
MLALLRDGTQAIGVPGSERNIHSHAILGGLYNLPFVRFKNRP